MKLNKKNTKNSKVVKDHLMTIRKIEYHNPVCTADKNEY